MSEAWNSWRSFGKLSRIDAIGGDDFNAEGAEDAEGRRD
jgi:hypothetical protein